MKHLKTLLTILILFVTLPAKALPVIYINQVAFDSRSPKIAVIGVDVPLTKGAKFTLINSSTLAAEFTGITGQEQRIDEWAPGKLFYRADFSAFAKTGSFKLKIVIAGKTYTSSSFQIADNALA